MTEETEIIKETEYVDELQAGIDDVEKYDELAAEHKNLEDRTGYVTWIDVENTSFSDEKILIEIELLHGDESFKVELSNEEFNAFLDHIGIDKINIDQITNEEIPITAENGNWKINMDFKHKTDYSDTIEKTTTRIQETSIAAGALIVLATVFASFNMLIIPVVLFIVSTGLILFDLNVLRKIYQKEYGWITE